MVTTQRRVGIALASFSALIYVSNLIERLSIGKFFFYLEHDVFYVMFIALFIRSAFRETLLSKVIQVLTLIGTAVFILAYSDNYSLSIAILSVAASLCYVYKYFDSSAPLKIAMFEAGYFAIFIAAQSYKLLTMSTMEYMIVVFKNVCFINIFCLIMYFIITDIVSKEKEEKIELIKAGLAFIDERKKRDGRSGPFKPGS